MGLGGQRHAPAALPLGKTRYPLYGRLGRPQGRSGRMRKISPPPGFDRRTVQPVASRYTDWAIPPPPPPKLATVNSQDIFLRLRILNENEENLVARVGEKEERYTGNER